MARACLLFMNSDGFGTGAISRTPHAEWTEQAARATRMRRTESQLTMSNGLVQGWTWGAYRIE